MKPNIKHDEKILRDALSRLVAGVWRGGDRSTRTEVHESIAPCFSIPASYERDADLILDVALDELMRLRAELKVAEAVCEFFDSRAEMSHAGTSVLANWRRVREGK